MDKATLYYILHVLSGFLLVGLTFQAFGHPDPDKRKGMMMKTGILSLVMLVGGFGLSATLNTGFPPWLILKIVCWLVLSAMAGMAYRKPGGAGTFALMTTLAVAAAVFLVYKKPTFGQDPAPDPAPALGEPESGQ